MVKFITFTLAKHLVFLLMTTIYLIMTDSNSHSRPLLTSAPALQQLSAATSQHSLYGSHSACGTFEFQAVDGHRATDVGLHSYILLPSFLCKLSCLRKRTFRVRAFLHVLQSQNIDHHLRTYDKCNFQTIKRFWNQMALKNCLG